MKTRLGWPCGVLGLALFVAACDVKVGDSGVSVDFAVGKATDEWVRTYDLKPGGRLAIENLNGVIEASSSTGTRVEVRATREARAGCDEAARSLLQKAEMREEVTPDSVRIEARTDQVRGGGFGGPQLTVRYDVRIPSGLTVLLKTQNGEVRMANLEGRLSASTTNGSVTGRGLSGSMEASTVNGGISIDLTSLTGDSRLVTVNGGVRLNLAPTVNADLEASVVNGGVIVDESLRLTADERSRQRVAGRIGNGGPRVVAQTTNGGIRVGTRSEPGT
jgi:hypothetical protein